MIINYGQEPKAHKLKGFAKLLDYEEYVADPNSPIDLQKKISECWENRLNIRHKLEAIIPEIQKEAKKNFELLKNLLP